MPRSSQVCEFPASSHVSVITECEMFSLVVLVAEIVLSSSLSSSSLEGKCQ